MDATNYVDILLVEDNPNDAELALRALGKVSGSPSVLRIEDGVRAIEYLFGQGAHAGRDVSRTPRFVMLDLKLPKIDGHEVLRRVRADQRFSKLPIIIFSSSKEERDLVECYRNGANSFIVKPVNFDVFMTVVNAMGEYWCGHNLLPREPYWSDQFDRNKTRPR
ncbi:MAG: response regulator [Burkholderiaceae bacterium]|nr:MAG: response regulator [Burkholderiaceae bacterium]